MSNGGRKGDPEHRLTRQGRGKEPNNIIPALYYTTLQVIKLEFR